MAINSAAARWKRRIRRIQAAALIMGFSCAASPVFATTATAIGFVELIEARPPLLSNVLPYPEDAGLQGARLGVVDNNSTGRFSGHSYQLIEARETALEPLLAGTRALLEQGVRYLVTKLPPAALEQLSRQAQPYGALIFNAAASDNQLRTEQCLSNVLHTIPSRAMLADALGQWLIAKKLRRWLLVVGNRPRDIAYAESIRRSAKRFGGQIVAEKHWTFDSDLRRTAQAEVPLFTQTAEYDAVVVADELGDFGEYLLYNTWYPRPVVGTQGLMPTAWHRVVEQWGAAQLQRRFDQQAQRWMNGEDYAAWAAVRSIGEGVSRAGKAETPAEDGVTTVRRYLVSERFQLGGFKGRKLTYRAWNGQLRQPIPLVHARALISQSPQEGYLHPKSDLDTLGFDQPESRCTIQQQFAGG